MLIVLASGLLIVFLAASSRRAKAQSTAAEERLNALVQYSPVEIFIKDSEGRYLLTNRRFDELRGSHAEFPPETAAMLSRHDQRVIREGRAIEFDELIPVRGGALRQYSTVKFPIVAKNGEFLGVGGISVDVTERRQQQDALEKAVRTRDDVLAVVSHDLKNPLNAIKLSGALLARVLVSHPVYNEDERIKRGLERIMRSSDQMEILIQDILDVNKIEAGKMDLEVLRVDAVELAYEAVRDLEELAKSKKISLQFDSECPPCFVNADPQRLQRVFSNVIGNAIKFTPEGGAIHVSVSIRGELVRFQVSDTGPGIRPENLPHLFDRYWQAKETAKKGTGLGLPIAKGIVDAHGGRIWAESILGKGTTFFVALSQAKESERTRSA